MAISTSEIDQILSLIGYIPPQLGIIAQTYSDRRYAQTAFTPTSATLYLFSVLLPQNELIKNIIFHSSGAESGGTHLWFALYDQSLNLLGQTADQTGAAAFPGTTALSLALTSAYTTTYSGLYYIGFCCVATGTPGLMGITALAHVTSIRPMTCASSSTGLGAVAPNPAAALTGITSQVYATVS